LFFRHSGYDLHRPRDLTLFHQEIGDHLNWDLVFFLVALEEGQEVLVLVLVDQDLDFGHYDALVVDAVLVFHVVNCVGVSSLHEEVHLV
jgi:hypothetical protein